MFNTSRLFYHLAKSESASFKTEVCVNCVCVSFKSHFSESVRLKFLSLRKLTLSMQKIVKVLREWLRLQNENGVEIAL